MTTEVLTHKSGKFVFSSQLDSQELNLLWVQMQILYQTVSDLPILPGLASHIHDELIKKSIFSTAAIEGNPLSEEDVGNIVDDKITGTERAEREISNLKRSYNYLQKLKPVEGKLPVSEKLIKNLHSSITKGVEYPDNTPGRYRSHRVQVGDKTHGGVYTPPKILEDVKMLMSAFVDWINSDEILELYPFYRAVLAHYYLGLIHPFGDGNGRTARLLEALILQSAGVKYIPIMMSNFYYERMDDYYVAFSETQRNKDRDITSFLKFSLEGSIESLMEIKSRITYSIRVMALRDYAHFQRRNKHITRRQFDLLEMLIDNPQLEFSLKDLRDRSPFSVIYRTVSPITPRRDTKKLMDMGLLVKEEDLYSLNLRALDNA